MTVRADLAIVKKELLEHKGSLFIAPAILIGLFFILINLQALMGGVAHVSDLVPMHPLYIMSFGATFGFFSIYMLITLFFYYADSFSADHKNNGLLFWKSLPISDLRILLLKLMTGTIIIPVIIVGWVMVASIGSYIIGVINAAHFTDVLAPWTALDTLVRLSIYLVGFVIIALLWLAPFYAWVAMLSVFFKKWSIALAFVIPMVVIAIEEIFSFDAFQTSYIAEFLSDRMTNIADAEAIENTPLGGFDGGPEEAIKSMEFAPKFMANLGEVFWTFVLNVRWVSLVGGLIVAGVFTYIGSEYRRRFIQG